MTDLPLWNPDSKGANFFLRGVNFFPWKLDIQNRKGKNGYVQPDQHSNDHHGRINHVCSTVPQGPSLWKEGEVCPLVSPSLCRLLHDVDRKLRGGYDPRRTGRSDPSSQGSHPRDGKDLEPCGLR